MGGKSKLPPITESHPEWLSEWDFELNDRRPEECTAGMKYYPYWICTNNHSYRSSGSNRAKGIGCPYCSGRITLPENSIEFTHKSLISEWDYTKNDRSISAVSQGSHYNAWWLCSKNHSYQTRVYDRTGKDRGGRQGKRRRRATGCPYCSGQRVNKDNCLAATHPQVCLMWNDESNSKTIYEVSAGSHYMAHLICGSQHKFVADISSICRGNGCPHCSKRISKLEKYWLDSMSIPDDIWHRQVKITIDKKNYHVDGFYHNVIYEFNGDFVHGNIKIYPENILNNLIGITFGDLHANLQKRESVFRSAGFKVISIWESQALDCLIEENVEDAVFAKYIKTRYNDTKRVKKKYGVEK